MPQACIVGTGSSIPEKILSNQELESIVDTSDEWIMRRTGIRERRISIKGRNENTVALTTRASLKALEMSGITPETLDMIVIGTVTSDRMFPSSGCLVQNELRATNAAAFDVSAGCSGFLYSLAMVDNAIKSGMCKNALIAGVDRLSSIINWQDRGTCVLLADGAGAVVVSSSKTQDGILSSHIKSDGSFWELLYSSDGNPPAPELLKDIDQKPYHLRMAGNRLFKKAISCMTSIAKEALQRNSLSNEDVALVIPHQANMRIILGLAKSLNIPMEKVYTNIHKYGNTSSGSIPIALDEANREGHLKKGDCILLVAFGAGLTWGSSILRWSI